MNWATVALATLALGLSGLACPSPTPARAPPPTPAATLTPEQARAEVVRFAKDMMAVRKEHQRQAKERTAFGAVAASMAPDLAIEKFTEVLDQSSQLHSRVSEMRTPSHLKAALVHGLYLNAFNKERGALSELFQGLLFGDLARLDKGTSMGQETEVLFEQAEAAFQDLLDAYNIQQSEISP